MTRSRRRSLRLLLLATVLLAAANAWLFVQHRETYSLWFVQYDDVYHLDEALRISDARVEAATLTLDIPDAAQERWSLAGGDALVPTSEGSIRLPLEPGHQRFRLVPQIEPWRAIEFGALYGFDEPLFIGDANVRFGDDAYFSLADFAASAEAYAIDRRRRAEEILESLRLAEASSDLERIERLASRLLRDLAPYRGRPSPAARRVDGLGQYEMALAGETEVYCANLAEIYGAFATLAGIPTRVVDVRGRIGDVRLGAHTFAESYVRDLREWVYVDLQLEVLHVRTSGGRPLNGAQLLQFHNAGAVAGLEATVYREERVVREPYKRVRPFVALQLHPSAILDYHFADTRRFSLGSRVLRHTLRPEPAYALGGTNVLLWTRCAAQVALLLSVGAWLVFAGLARTRGARSTEPTRAGP